MHRSLITLALLSGSLAAAAAQTVAPGSSRPHFGGQASAEELRFASWPEVIAMIPCDRIGRDEAGGLVVLGPIYVEEKHFSARAVTRPFETKEIRARCFQNGSRMRHHDDRPYYPYRYGHPFYYSPGPFLLPELPS
jgi:hypothetical protein